MDDTSKNHIADIENGMNNSNENNNNDYNNNDSNSENKLELNSTNTKTFETPAMKKWFIRSGLLPKIIFFTTTERRTAKLYKILHMISTKGTTALGIFYMFYGFGIDFNIALVLGIAMAIQHLTYENKTRFILSKSFDMLEVLQSPEDCKKLHNMVKQFDRSLFLCASQIIPQGIFCVYPLYRLFSLGNYVGFGILIFDLCIEWINNFRQVYTVFLKEFVFHRNEKEIQGYLLKVKDIVLSNEKGRTASENLKILEKNQSEFEYRMTERKKTFFYHPMNVLMGIVIPLLCVTAMVFRTRTNDTILEIATHFFLMGFGFAFANILLGTHAFQLAQGPQVFTKYAKKLQSLRFMKQIEVNLNMKYELFQHWLLVNQKEIVTVKIVGNPINGDTAKKLLAIVASLSSLALIYIGRSLILGDS